MSKVLVVSSLQQGYPKRSGNILVWRGTMKGPDSYDTGGSRPNVGRGFGGIRFVHAINCGAAVNAADNARYEVTPIFDYLNDKPTDIQATTPGVRFMFVDAATGLQPAGATNLSGVRFRVEVYGTL